MKNSRTKINLQCRNFFRGMIVIAFLLVPMQQIYALEKFQDLYKRIYDSHTHRTDEEQEERVCRRVQERPKFKTFSCSDLFLLEEGIRDEGLRDRFKWSKQVHKNWVDWTRDALKEEREMLWYEDKLLEKINHMSIYADRKRGEAFDQMPYDLIDDLDEIDEIIFGEKARKKDQPRPSFVYKKSKALDPTTIEWDWQDGFKQIFPCYIGYCNSAGLTTNPRDYSEEDGLIASNFANMKHVIEYRLADLSQVAECVNTRIYQPMGWYNLPEVGDLYHQKIMKAPIHLRDLEVEDNQREKINERFFAIEEEMRLQTSCENTLEEDRRGKYDVPNSDMKDLIEQCNTIRDERWDERIETLKKTARLEGEKIYFRRMFRVLDRWNDDWEAWYDQIVKLKKIFRDLAHKPKKL